MRSVRSENSSVRSARDALVGVRESEDLLSAYRCSPIGGGFSVELEQARGLLESKRLKRQARLAVVASLLLAGAGPEARA